MKNISLVAYEKLSLVFKALSHPVRLFMVEQVAEGEKCVCELVEALGLEPSTVSKHLSVLRNAGVLEDEKRGNMVFFRIRVECVLGFFSCVRETLESQASEQLAAVAK